MPLPHLTPSPTYSLRPIEAVDDAAVAAIIRVVMPEFGAVGKGFAIEDPEVDTMFATYQQPRSAYWVMESGGHVVGGGGVAPLKGASSDTCELQKFYILNEARGLGAGKELLTLCLNAAKQFGYRRCYLETLGGMETAQRLYLSHGFTPIPAPLGATGHTKCNAWFIREVI